MQFCYKYDDGNGRLYQIAFSAESGLSLSTTCTYSALLINNHYVGHCEGKASGALFCPTFELHEGHHYKILSNVNCWDLLVLMETEYVEEDLIIDICFGPIITKKDESGENGLTGAQGEGQHDEPWTSQTNTASTHTGSIS